MGEARGHFCWNPRVRRISRAIPSDPRCKLCDTPFGRPGINVLRYLGFGPSRINRRICSGCIHALEKRPGGAEVEATFLFADVRGSTGLAERLGAEEFRTLMARFYSEAASVVDVRNGIVDKFVGDELVALFIPGFVGPDHASAAVAAAQELLERTGHPDEPWLPLGAGVHTGAAFIGTVGQEEIVDFTALGDAVNAAARLASMASAGEILVSSDAATAAGLDDADLDTRKLELRGRSDEVDALVLTAQGAHMAPR